MANKRNFKKYVHELTSAVANDMMGATYIFDDINKESVDNAIIKLLAASEAALVKVNVKFDKTLKAFGSANEYRKAKSKFFNDLYNKTASEFGKAVKEALSVYNASFSEKTKNDLKAEAGK